MTTRRPLTAEEQAAAHRLKKIFNQAKARYKAEGKKLTQEIIAGEFGWSGQAAVSQYMNGNVPLNLKALSKFARFLGVEPSDIYPELAELLPNATLWGDKMNAPSGSDARVPLISWVQAGAWQEVVDVETASDAERWILCPVPHSSKTFALKVVGQSMQNPGDRHSFDDGDIIHVDPEVPAENKSLVVVQINGDTEATFKQLIIEGGQHFLKALNPAWPNRIIQMPEDSRICGVVISKTVSFR